MCQRKLRAQLDRPLMACDSPIQIADSFERNSQVAISFNSHCVQLQRSLNAMDGILRVMRPQCSQAQKMPRDGIAWIGGDNLAVERGRFLQFSRLVLANSRFELARK